MTKPRSRDERRRARRRPSLRGALLKLLRTRISAGLITILPVVVTVWLIRLVFGLIRGTTQRVVEWYLLSDSGKTVLERWDVDVAALENVLARRAELGLPAGREVFANVLPWTVQWGIGLLSVALTFFLLYLVGLFTANLIGRRVVDMVDAAIDRVPLIKTIYRGIKQIALQFTSDQQQNFQRVALVPFPQERMRCVGFITATFEDSLTHEELATVFIPTTPNPTTGYLQIVRRKELVELDWSVEEAVRTIMSGGILRPDYLTIVPNEDLARYGRQPLGDPIAAPELQPPQKPQE